MRNWILLILLSISLGARSQEPGWISAPTARDVPNLWQAYRLDLDLTAADTERYPLQIAVDSKYWLWVNDSLLVREGGLKRGPKPDTYYHDEVDIAPALRPGKNHVALLTWYFGKDGFSHQSSHVPALWIDGPPAVRTDTSWRVIVHPAFGYTAPPQPNYRLPESNILFNASAHDRKWTTDNSFGNWPRPRVLARENHPSGGAMEPRPVPQWKDYGLRSYLNEIPKKIYRGDTIRMAMPYNAQVTPYFEVYAPRAGMRIELRTDNYRGGGAPNVRTVYLTKAGRQTFETLAWMNGHEVWYILEEGIKPLRLAYRETGYDTELTGSFVSSDRRLNRLWTKAQRTLYLTMRDTYMDCPDRERAQWWGDVVNALGENFYALDRRSDALTRKAIRELMRWQRPDSTIYSPVPSGNWDKELPMQMLASVGYYGIWHYYYNTGDRELLEEVYPAVKRYVEKWETQKNGLVVPRGGGWVWGDWGDNKDMTLLYNAWYYLALRGLGEMARELEDDATATFTDVKMSRLRLTFNQEFWTGTEYRDPDYGGATDDRAHALAVVSGLTPKSYYSAIGKVLREQEHASPYLEKYVLEALATMGDETYMIERMKKRFGKMIDSELTTLWEGWGVGEKGYGGGTYNHAWSGGGLTVMSRFLAGVEPTDLAWKSYRLRPAGWPALDSVSAVVPTPRGELTTDWSWSEEAGLRLRVKTAFRVPSTEILLPVGMSVRARSVTGASVLPTRLGRRGTRDVWRVPGGNFELSASGG